MGVRKWLIYRNEICCTERAKSPDTILFEMGPSPSNFTGFLLRNKRRAEVEMKEDFPQEKEEDVLETSHV